jgi:hypothetical protein
LTYASTGSSRALVPIRGPRGHLTVRSTSRRGYPAMKGGICRRSVVSASSGHAGPVRPILVANANNAPRLEDQIDWPFSRELWKRLLCKSSPTLLSGLGCRAGPNVCLLTSIYASVRPCVKALEPRIGASAKCWISIKRSKGCLDDRHHADPVDGVRSPSMVSSSCPAVCRPKATTLPQPTLCISLKTCCDPWLCREGPHLPAAAVRADDDYQHHERVCQLCNAGPEHLEGAGPAVDVC